MVAETDRFADRRVDQLQVVESRDLVGEESDATV
jgi:hypothetical protein